MKAVVVGASVSAEREDRLAPDEATASLGALCVSALIERFLSREMPQQLGEILAAQVFAQSSVRDSLAEFVEDGQSDVLFIGDSAFVRPKLFASLADQGSAAKLPQVRRGLFAAFAEFQIEAGDRSVFVKHA